MLKHRMTTGLQNRKGMNKSQNDTNMLRKWHRNFNKKDRLYKKQLCIGLFCLNYFQKTEKQFNFNNKTSSSVLKAKYTESKYGEREP